MKYKNSVATLLLSAAIISASGLTSVAYAHEGWNKSDPSMHCEQGHLSKEKIELLRSAFKKVHEDNKTVFEELHKLRKEQHDILVAKAFNKEAFLSVSAKIEQKRAQLAKSHAQAFASIADKFTSEERERLSRMWRHHHGHHHGGWGHHEWKQGEGHEGWHHHGGDSNNGLNDKTEMPPDAAQEETAPAPAQ